MTETFDMSYQATNITRVRGDTFPFSFVIKDSSGNVVDISGFSYKLSVDPSEEPANDDNQLFQVVGVIPTGTDGVVNFTLSSANADQTPATYYYDVEQTDTNSKIRTVAKGEWIVEQDVTKEP